jgi:hypothetical protein
MAARVMPSTAPVEATQDSRNTSPLAQGSRRMASAGTLRGVCGIRSTSPAKVQRARARMLSATATTTSRRPSMSTMEAMFKAYCP